MRTRHKIPTLFTLSMMDVFCCCLGCVILLWLWNERVAKQKAKTIGETRVQLDAAREDLAALRERLQSLESELGEARGSASALAADLKSTRTDLDGARGKVADLTAERARLQDELATRDADLKDLRARVTDSAARLAKQTKDAELAADAAADLLAKKQKEHEKLSASLDTARKRALELETLSRQQEERLALSAKRVEDLTDRLHETEGKLKQVKTTADSIPGLRGDLDLTARKLTAAETRVQELERDLTLRRRATLDLQGQMEELRTEKKKTDDQFARLRVAADNRFAGIQLTGRRVLLLVDMSGSMKSTEENVPAPDKWPAVAETAAKILKSLPDLEKFQVILFSEEAGYPLGQPGQWFDYDAATSADKVRAAILKIVPQGNTNLYVPFEFAFKHFRPQGLDTVYLLSDGLPNTGPGLTAAEQARNLNEDQRGALLGKYLRNLLKSDWNRTQAGRERVKINSVGFFYESPDVGAFLWALSRENEGSFVGMSKP
ncbi:MAG: VWA domain-containing protein [Gemmataceae bacterium]